jgi:hypothetical protein
MASFYNQKEFQRDVFIQSQVNSRSNASKTLYLHFLNIIEYLHYPDFLTHLLKSHIFLKSQIKSQLVHLVKLMLGTKNGLKDGG